MYVGISNPRWQGKRCRHSGRMCNPHFYVAGKRTVITKCRAYEQFGSSAQMVLNNSFRIRDGDIFHWFISGINSSPPEKIGLHFGRRHFQIHLSNEKFCILINILLKIVRKGQIKYIPALVQMMAWPRIGDKPLSACTEIWIIIFYHTWERCSTNWTHLV